MKAFTLDGFTLRPPSRDDLPEPGAGEKRVGRAGAPSSVNPVDAFIAAGALRGMPSTTSPSLLGRDFAGVVEQVGDGVGRYRVGEEVFGFLLHADPTVHFGSWAELIAVPEDNFVTPKPGGVGFDRAGAAPLAGITAIAAFDALAPAEGPRRCSSSAPPAASAASSSSWPAAAGAPVIAPAFAGFGTPARPRGHWDPRPGCRHRRPGARAPRGVEPILDVVSQAADTSSLRDGGRLASPIGAAGEARVA